MNTLLDMSITSTVIILFVLLFRFLLKDRPKIFSYLLWGVVLFRLLCPVSFHSDISVFSIFDIFPSGEVSYGENIPSQDMTTPDVIIPDEIIPALPDGGYEGEDITVTYHPQEPDITIQKDTAIMNSATEDIFAAIWVLGMGMIVLYSVISLNILRRRLKDAIKSEEGYFESESIDTPFVLGFIRPQIYLPKGLSEHEKLYILIHEQHHIKRLDHITKVLFFAALCIHWFNPMVWVAFGMFSKDMEMSCDEAVMKKMGEEIKADYALSLLNLSTKSPSVSPSPLAFGEADTKDRIKNLAKYKKPTLAAVIIASVITLMAGIMLLTDPDTDDEMIYGANYEVKDIIYDVKFAENDLIEDIYIASRESLQITAAYDLYIERETTLDEYVGELEEYYLTKEELKSYAMKDSAWVGSKNFSKITDSYIVRLEEDRFYLFFKTKSGRMYVAYGWEDVSERGEGASDDTFVEYIHELENVMAKDHFDTSFFENSIDGKSGYTDTMGMYKNAEHPDYAVVAFKGYDDGTSGYGYGVFSIHEDGTSYKLLKKYIQEESEDAGGIYLCDEPAVLDSGGVMTDKNTYDVILCTNENVSEIIRLVDDSKTTRQNKYEVYTNCILIPWEDEKDAVRVTTIFYDRSGNQIGKTYSKAGTKNTDSTVYPFGQVYEVSHVAYESVNSPEKTDEGMYFMLGGDYSLYLPDKNDITGFKKIGTFEEKALSPANFDGYFKEDSWIGFPHGAEWLRKCSEAVWTLENDGKIYHLLRIADGGGVYLCLSYSGETFPENDEEMYALWCAKLREVPTAQGETATLPKSGYIYHAPHLSTTPDSLPEYRYYTYDTNFTVTKGGTIIAGSASYDAEAFPWNDEDWEELFAICPEALKEINEKYTSLTYKPLGGSYFIIFADNDTWLMEKPDKLISTIYALKAEKMDDAFQKSDSPYQFTKNIDSNDITFATFTGFSGTNSRDLTEQEIKELTGYLNNLSKISIKEGSTDGRVSVLLYCGGREVLLKYDDMTHKVGISFDKDTAELFGGKSYLIDDIDLNGFFMSMLVAEEDGPFMKSDSFYRFVSYISEDDINSIAFATYVEDVSMKQYEYSLDKESTEKLVKSLNNVKSGEIEKGVSSEKRISEVTLDCEGRLITLMYCEDGSVMFASTHEVMHLYGGSNYIIKNTSLTEFFRAETERAKNTPDIVLSLNDPNPMWGYDYRPEEIVYPKGAKDEVPLMSSHAIYLNIYEKLTIWGSEKVWRTYSYDEFSLSKENFDDYFDKSGKTVAEDLRADNSKAYVAKTDNPYIGEYYYILEQTDGRVYSVCIKDTRQPKVRWVALMERCDNVSINIYADSTISAYPQWYADDESIGEIGPIDIEHKNTGDISINIATKWDAETITVSEEYYEQTSDDSVFIDRKTYDLTRDQHGDFYTITIPHRNEEFDEDVRFFIRGEEGRYVFLVRLKATK